MRYIITAPTVEPSRHNLIESANIIDEADAYWEGGLTFEPDGCAIPTAHLITCPPDELSEPTQCTGVEADYMPYMIEVAIEQQANADVIENARTKVQRVLGRARSAAMETVLVNGLAGSSNIFLANQTGLTTVTSAPSKPAVALGLLQEELTARGVEGTIYASPLAVNLLPNLVEAEENRLFTTVRHDMVVVSNVADAAPNTTAGTPVAADAGSRWLFAHVGSPDVRLGEPQINVEVVRSTNRVIARAVQTVAVTFDPCVRIAAEIDIS